MKCPYCSALETKVIDSRINQTNDITRRRRECPICEGRFTTYERVEEVMPAVIKKDARREPFSREKIMNGLKKACQKRPVTTLQLEEVVARIERRIASFGAKEIPSKNIGLMVMQELSRLDKVAYVRFAAVYREFQDVEQFVAELTQTEPPSPEDDPSLLVFPFASVPTETKKT
ncbi:MAG: transcriptional regulator NrdR [Oligoflexia bacterium]|jgi:transcriptional repressor NrdR